MRTEVKLMDISIAIGQTDWGEVGVFEAVQSIQFGYLLVEALAASCLYPRSTEP